MANQGKEADLRVRETQASTASDHLTHGPIHGPDSNAADAEPLSGGTTGRSAPRTGLSEHTRNRLASQLRALYDTVAQQPVPDRFAELIAKLDGGTGR